MKINGSENIDFLSKLQKAATTHKTSVAATIKAISTDDGPLEETPAVKVSISSEGKESCRNSRLMDNSETYESMMERKSELLLGDAPMYRLYCFKYTPIGGEKSIEDIASDLLKSYANMYDKIVQGYKTGNRKSCIEDSESENGYRLMTMSEEISALNESFNGAVNSLMEQIKQIPENIKMMKNMQKNRQEMYNIISKRYGLQDDNTEKFTEAISRMENIVIPENIGEKMMAAVKTFVDQYSKHEMVDLESMLKNINIFKTDSESTSRRQQII